MMQLDYQDQIKRKIRQATKQKDVAAILYYTEAMKMSACVSWERFRGSWAGENWMDLHDKIMAALDTIGRGIFSMSCSGIVAFEVSKLVGQEVTYSQIATVVNAREAASR